LADPIASGVPKVGKKVLIVEDDDHFREALVSYLQMRGYVVVAAPNGKVGRDILGIQEFDLVISDIQMPFLDGIELLKWMKGKHDIPFILMTGFSNLLETQTAYELGANEFLAKPFKNAELIRAIESLLFPKASDQPTDLSHLEFCKVSIDEFVARPRIDFDVYVRLGEKRMIKIGHAGDEIPTERIQVYKEKGLKYLYITKEDFAKLVDFNMELTRVVLNNKSVAPEKKLNFIKYTGEVILEKAFVAGVNQELFGDAKDMLVATVNVLGDQQENVDLLDALNNHSDWVYAHSVATAMFSMMISRKMGHSASQVFFKLGMAGMFHEIGYKEIPKEILEKPRPLLTQAERAMLETHVSRGRDILTYVKGVPNDVVDIVFQHHEDLLGQGYPRGLHKNHIHPLAKIFQVADIFTDLALRGPQYTGMTGPDAVSKVATYYGDKLDPEAVQALKSIFKAS